MSRKGKADQVQTAKHAEGYPAVLNTTDWSAVLPIISTEGCNQAQAGRLVERSLKAGHNAFYLAAHHDSMRCFEAWRECIAKHSSEREAMIVSVGLGFFSFDGDPGPDPKGRLIREWVMPGDLDRESFVGLSHSFHPKFIQRQVLDALKKLDLSQLDIAWLESPEIQRAEFGESEFYPRLKSAFEKLEALRAEGQLSAYGIRFENGLNVDRTSESFISFAKIMKLRSELNAKGLRYIRLNQAPSKLRSDIEFEELTLLEPSHFVESRDDKAVH